MMQKMEMRISELNNFFNASLLVVRQYVHVGKGCMRKIFVSKGGGNVTKSGSSFNPTISTTRFVTEPNLSIVEAVRRQVGLTS